MKLGRIGFAILTFAVLVLGQAGCSSNPYRHFNGEYGYSDAPISGDQFEVAYTGEADTSPTQARYYATVRAAEVAEQHGKAYFEILKSDWAERTETVAMPGDTFINESGGHHRGSHFTTITQTPGYVRNYASPTSVLTVRLLDQKTRSALETQQVLAEAAGKGVQLSERPAR